MLPWRKRHTQAPPSRIVVGLGVYSSASTWVVNVLLALLRAGGSPDVALHYADDLAAWDQAPPARRVVVKSHRADAAMLERVARERVPVLISVRDPCDAAASLVTRFGVQPHDAAEAVCASYAACAQALALPNHLVLRYETGALGSLAGVRAIAAHLGLQLGAAQLAGIAQRHAPAQIIAQVEALRARGVFDGSDPLAQWDAATFWHPNHVGDGRVGKYAAILPAEMIAALRDRTAAFQSCFPALPTGASQPSAPAR